MSPATLCVPAMGNHALPLTQLGRMERELEAQIKDSLEESQALREKFERDVEHVKKDSERRLMERNRYTKKQKEKWKERFMGMEREKADMLQQAGKLHVQFVAFEQEICLGKERIFQLESEVQTLRSGPRQVVERSNPGAAVEVMRLRDKITAKEEEARRAQRSAAEAQAAAGREAAVNQAFQRDIDNARHRLLTAQGSLAELSEENARLRRELEGERIKVTAGSHRLADAVERQEQALSEVRRDSVQLREQRDRFAQESAVLGMKLHKLQKKEAARRLLHALTQVQRNSLATALRAFVTEVIRNIHSNKMSRQQQEHASEVVSLETDLDRAEARFRDVKRRLDIVQESRETIAELAVTAYRRRQRSITAAATVAGERGTHGDDSNTFTQKWCFWGWVMVTRNGSTAVARREKRAEAEEELPGVRKMLSTAVERARGADAERDRHRANAETMTEENTRLSAKLEGARVALNTTEGLASSMRDRYARLGVTRMCRIFQQNQRTRIASALQHWADSKHEVVSASSQTDAVLPGLHDTYKEVVDDALPSSTLTHEERRRQWVEAGSKAQPIPEACQENLTVDGIRRKPASNRASNEPPPEDVLDRKGTTNMLGVGEELEATQSPAKSAFFVAAVNRSSKRNIRDAANKTVASTGNISPNSITSPSGPLHFQDSPTPWMNRPIDSSAPMAFNEDVEYQAPEAHVNMGDETLRRSPCLQRSFAEACTSDPRTPINRRATTQNLNRTSVLQSYPDISGQSTSSDPAHVVLALRAAIGNELYVTGDRLLRCVEADHREVHGRTYSPIPITGAERDQFHACLMDASRGSLRCLILHFLRMQESYRAAAVERTRNIVHSRRETWQVRCGRGKIDATESRYRGPGGAGDGLGDTKRKKIEDKRDIAERQGELFSIVTGPLSSPAEKARAARVLRDRLVPLLDAADEAWVSHRRQWQHRRSRRAATTSHLGSSRQGTVSATAAARERKKVHRPRSGNSSGRKCPYVDSGAGPRKFWETLAGPRLVDSGWNMEQKALEQQLWDLVMLVRNQDRHCPCLPLDRCEHLRRTLDGRIYELLLLQLRTQLIWDGIEDDSDAGDAGRGGFSTVEGPHDFCISGAQTTLSSVIKPS